MNHQKCVDCKEPTKCIVGFWDGQDPKTRKPTSGLLYDCNNMECSLKQRQKALYDDAEKQRQHTIQENKLAGVDMKTLEEKKKESGTGIKAMSDYLEISPVVYSDYKAERLPMPRELYEKALNYLTA